MSQSLRGRPYDAALFRPTGANTAKAIQTDAQGLRLLLSKTRPNNLPIGLISRASLRGDFEITMSFTIVKVEQPSAGNGAGISVWLSLPTPERDAATVAWLRQTDGATVFIANRAFSADSGKRQYDGASPMPTAASSGKLRLTRKGDVLAWFVSEGSSRDFREVFRSKWPTADVETVRFAAESGGSPTTADVRVNEVTIVADEFGSARIITNPESNWLNYIGWASALGLATVGIYLRYQKQHSSV